MEHASTCRTRGEGGLDFRKPSQSQSLLTMRTGQRVRWVEKRSITVHNGQTIPAWNHRFRWGRSRRNLCALIRFISSSSAFIFSSCCSFFDFDGSLPRSFSSAFSTDSLVVSAISNPHCWSSGFFFAKHMIARLDRYGIWSRSTIHQPAENTAMIIKITGRSPPAITTAVKQVSLSNSATSGDPSFQILLWDGAAGLGTDRDPTGQSISEAFVRRCAVRSMRTFGEASREFFRRSAARSGRMIEPCGATGSLPKAPCKPRIALLPRWRIYNFPCARKHVPAEGGLPVNFQPAVYLAQTAYCDQD